MNSRHPHRHPVRRRELPALFESLRRGSLKLTAPRQALLDVLNRCAHPMCIRELHAAVADCPCDLATVYRSMHSLEKLRLVKRYDFGDGIARFELLREGDDGQHHHLVCTRCANVVEIEECGMAGLDEAIGSRNGFASVTHRLEFFGVCPACQK